MCFLYGQSFWPGEISFQYSGLENGSFSARSLPDSLELPTEGTLASITMDSLGSANIIIPSFMQNQINPDTYDVFILYMKDEDGVIENQSWDVDLIDTENIFGIDATMMFMTQVDTTFLFSLIDPILNGEVNTENWNEYITGVIASILVESYLSVSGTITVTQGSEEFITGSFSGLMGELGWPPQIIYIEDGQFEYENPVVVPNLDPPSNVIGENDGDNILIHWEYPDTALITHFNIYHGMHNDSIPYFSSVDFNNRQFIYDAPNPGLHFFYLTAVSGILESQPSNIISVLIEDIHPGDVNFDGTVNVLDIVKMITFILEDEIPTDSEFSASDVNEDNTINILDIVLIVNMILD
jgi:hypothetical protein